MSHAYIYKRVFSPFIINWIRLPLKEIENEYKLNLFEIFYKSLITLYITTSASIYFKIIKETIPLPLFSWNLLDPHAIFIVLRGNYTLQSIQ